MGMSEWGVFLLLLLCVFYFYCNTMIFYRLTRPGHTIKKKANNRIKGHNDYNHL